MCEISGSARWLRVWRRCTGGEGDGGVGLRGRACERAARETIRFLHTLRRWAGGETQRTLYAGGDAMGRLSWVAR